MAAQPPQGPPQGLPIGSVPLGPGASQPPATAQESSTPAASGSPAGAAGSPPASPPPASPVEAAPNQPQPGGGSAPGSGASSADGGATPSGAGGSNLPPLPVLIGGGVLLVLMGVVFIFFVSRLILGSPSKRLCKHIEAEAGDVFERLFDDDDEFDRCTLFVDELTRGAKLASMKREFRDLRRCIFDATDDESVSECLEVHEEVLEEAQEEILDDIEDTYARPLCRRIERLQAEEDDDDDESSYRRYDCSDRVAEMVLGGMQEADDREEWMEAREDFAQCIREVEELDDVGECIEDFRNDVD